MASKGTPLLPVLAGLAGVLGLAVAAVYLLRDDPAATPSDGSRAVIQAPEATETASERELPVSVPDGREEPPPAELPPSGGLRGRVVDASHVPLTRGSVAALAEFGAPGMGGGVRLKSVGLDPAVLSGDGRFHFVGLPVDTDITLRAEGHDFVVTDAGPFAIRTGETKDIGDIVTHEGYTILGTVRDQDGKPVAGARVALGYGSGYAQFASDEHSTAFRVVLTGEDGRFKMPHSPRHKFVLTASADGYATKLVNGGSGLGIDLSTLEMTIVLEKARVLKGIVVSARNDKPVSNITLTAVNVGPIGGQGVTSSDKDGQFVFKDLAPGPHRIAATGDGWSKATLKLSAAEMKQELTVRMAEAGSIEGRVTTPDGKPLPRYDLGALYGRTRVTAFDPTGRPLRVRSNEGRFEVKNLQPGWYSLEVWANGFALTTTEAIRVRAGRPVKGVAITMQYGATIRGRVVDDLQQPIAGATISLHGNNRIPLEYVLGKEWKSSWQLSTNTDKDGVFQLTEVSERVYQVQVKHPDYPVVLVNDVATQLGNLADLETIVVPRAGVIEGVALDPSGQLLRRGSITLSGPTHGRTVPDGEGRFAFRNLLPGKYVLDARSDKQALGFSFAFEIQRGKDLVPIHVGPGETVTTTLTTP